MNPLRAGIARSRAAPIGLVIAVVLSVQLLPSREGDSTARSAVTMPTAPPPARLERAAVGTADGHIGARPERHRRREALDLAGARRAALVAVADTEDPAQFERLVRTLLRDPDPLLREEAVAALAGDHDGPDVMAALQAALRDSSYRTRAAALHALIAIGGEEAVLVIGAQLGSGGPRFRVAAIDALGTIGGTQARWFLRSALQDADAGVRAAAAEWLEEPPGPSGSRF